MLEKIKRLIQKFTLIWEVLNMKESKPLRKFSKAK